MRMDSCGIPDPMTTRVGRMMPVTQVLDRGRAGVFGPLPVLSVVEDVHVVGIARDWPFARRCAGTA